MMKSQIIENAFQPTGDNVCTISQNGMVSTAFPHATMAGVQQLANSGNAVDAAVSAALALCVCEPQASGIGGQSSALIHFHNETVYLDGSGKIPALYENSLITPEDVQAGYRGTTVPTTISALFDMHARFGILPWKDVVMPAYLLAKEGYTITNLQHDLQVRESDLFALVPGQSGAFYFLKDELQPYEPGDVFTQPELADVLDQIARYGKDAFYKGDIASAIEKDMVFHHGFLRKTDLENIPVSIFRSPIESTILGSRIVTTAPPTQGRLLLITARQAAQLQKESDILGTAKQLGRLGDFLYEAFRERMENPIHPEKYDVLNDKYLVDENIQNNIYHQVLSQQPTHSIEKELRGGETTHLSVMDKYGNAVGITQSVNMVYGSKAAAGGLGFMYNNYLIDNYLFSDDHPHAPIAGGTAPSSIAPFMIFNQGKPWLVAGSPGSQRIVSTLAQFITHIMGKNLPIDQAMMMPRIHSQKKRHIILEENRFSPEIQTALTELGYTLDFKAPFHMGAVHAVLKCAHKNEFQGVAEHRRDGIAMGPDNTMH